MSNIEEMNKIVLCVHKLRKPGPLINTREQEYKVKSCFHKDSSSALVLGCYSRHIFTLSIHGISGHTRSSFLGFF
jgi:hypothetical protein